VVARRSWWPARVEVVGVVERAVEVDDPRQRSLGWLVPAGAVLVAVTVTLLGTVAGRSPVGTLPVALLGPALAVAVAALPVGRYAAPPVRRFSLRPLAGGRTLRCLLPGEPAGSGLRPGAIVRVTTRPGRHGHRVLPPVELLGTTHGPVVGRVPVRTARALLRARWIRRLQWAAAVLAVLWPPLAVVGSVFG
jgi:hypothetical protein